MGTTVHHAIIVSSWSLKHLHKARAAALSVFPPQQVTKIGPEVTNGYCTFYVGPDGSKEGWEVSDVGDENRAVFLERLNRLYSECVWITWVEVRYGGSEPDLAEVITAGPSAELQEEVG